MTREANGIVPILCYHAISDEVPHDEMPFAFSPSTFTHHLDLIDQLGLTTIMVTDLVDARVRGDDNLLRDRIAITFDDGYADLQDVVLPELRARGMVATVFVTTSYVEARTAGRAESERWLSWDEVVTLAESRTFEIGAHSHDHLELDMVGAEAACVQAERSRDLLAARAGVDATAFAYPYGYSTPLLRQALAHIGYRAACSVKHALSSAADDPFDLARVRLMRRHDRDTLKGWMSGDGLRVAPCRPELRTTAYKLVRRGLRLVRGRSRR